MSKILLPQNAYIQIDRIHVTGPCKHKPSGWVFYERDKEVGFVAAGATRTKEELKAGADDAIIQSKDIKDDGFAYLLSIECCPGKVLQKHNVFGHSSVCDYVYAVFDRTTRALGIKVDPQDREEWRKGFVLLTEIHLTGNFGCAAQYVLPIIQAVDDNNVEGKQRLIPTCITLGLTGKGRSKYHALTIYYKRAELESAWKRPGAVRKKLIEGTTNAIRAEVKLYSQGLKTRGLQYAAKWLDVDVAALFFEIFNTYQVNYAIQPLLTEKQLQVLSKSELIAYYLWLAGHSLEDLFSRTTIWTYTKSIKAKTDIDVSGNNRPEPLPKIHLKNIFRPENVLPIPDWVFGTEYYFPPNQPDLPRRRGMTGISDAPVDSNRPPDEIIWFNGEPIVI